MESNWPHALEARHGHDHIVLQLVQNNFLSYSWGLSQLVGNPMTAETVKKVINERLSYKNTTMSLLHLIMWRATLYSRESRELLRAPTTFLCGGCHRNGVPGCGCSSKLLGIFPSWCSRVLRTTLQQCAFNPDKSFSHLRLPQRGHPAFPDTYQQIAGPSNADLALSPLRLKESQKVVMILGLEELLLLIACWSSTPVQLEWSSSSSVQL